MGCAVFAYHIAHAKVCLVAQEVAYVVDVELHTGISFAGFAHRSLVDGLLVGLISIDNELLVLQGCHASYVIEECSTTRLQIVFDGLQLGAEGGIVAIKFHICRVESDGQLSFWNHDDGDCSLAYLQVCLGRQHQIFRDGEALCAIGVLSQFGVVGTATKRSVV